MYLLGISSWDLKLDGGILFGFPHIRCSFSLNFKRSSYANSRLPHTPSWSHEGKGRRTSGSAETCKVRCVRTGRKAKDVARLECIMIDLID